MAHVGSPTSGATGAAGTVCNCTALAAGIAAGHTLALGLATTAIDATVPVVTVTDPRGNVWTTEPGVNAASATALAVVTCRVATALQAGDVITVTISPSATRMAVTVEDFGDTTFGVDKNASNNGSSGSLSSGVTTATVQASELVVGGFALTNSGRIFTAGAGFTAGPKVISVGGSSDRAVVLEWKYVTSTGTQEATGTLNSAGGYAGHVVTLKSVDDTPPAGAAVYEWNGTSLIGPLTVYEWNGTSLVGPLAVEET